MHCGSLRPEQLDLSLQADIHAVSHMKWHGPACCRGLLHSPGGTVIAAQCMAGASGAAFIGTAGLCMSCFVIAPGQVDFSTELVES